MNTHAKYFKLLKIYADFWARHNCSIMLSGEENIHTDRPRIYIVSHPTTWDLPLLVHISRRNFYIVVAEGPFAHPLVSWIFHHSGFFQLTKGNSQKVIEETGRLVENGNPLIYSLKGYGVDFGEDVRPRTGGIRAAHLAQADICPIQLMLENDEKRIFKYYNKSKTESYPYTVFHNTLYFVTFLPSLRYEDYAKENMTYEDYKKIAFSIEDSFTKSQDEIRQRMKADSEFYKKIKRKGGSKKQVTL